ncbi:IS30 family transposase [Rhizobium leguminosarum]
MIFERVQGNANVATVVERTSRFTMLFKNNDRIDPGLAPA